MISETGESPASFIYLPSHSLWEFIKHLVIGRDSIWFKKMANHMMSRLESTSLPGHFWAAFPFCSLFTVLSVCNTLNCKTRCFTNSSFSRQLWGSSLQLSRFTVHCPSVLPTSSLYKPYFLPFLLLSPPPTPCTSPLLPPTSNRSSE